MTTPYPPPRRGIPLHMVRDALSVALMLVGLVGTVWTLFAIDTKAGALSVFVLLFLGGVALGARLGSTNRRE